MRITEGQLRRIIREELGAPEGDGRGLVRKMFASAKSWVDSIPSDGTRATIVSPW